jgi:membrane protein
VTAETPKHGSLVAFFRAVWRFIDVMSAHNAFEGASAIAFWFFLSAVPLLVFVGWLLGSIARSRGIDFLVQPALEVLPGPAAESLFRKELERMSGGGSAPIAPISIVGFLWTSSSGLHNLMDIFEIAVKVERRPWWKQRAIALVWIGVGLIAAVITTWVLVRVDESMHDGDAQAAQVTSDSPAPSASDRAHKPNEPAGRRAKIKQRITKILHTPSEKLIAGGAMLVVITTILAGFYRWAVEHPAGVKRRAWPGAIVAVVSWLVVSYGFGAYVSSLGNYALYYGGLAAVAVLLIWLYLTSLALVFGAEVNAQLEGVRG